MATVLVVDDRATNREFARATLDHGGHRVIEASEGHQALRIARATHPDVVLTDVVMPGMDGYEFAHELHAHADTAHIPVLIYTANYRPDEAQPLASAYGVTKVLSKSADPFDLLAAVEEALTQRTPAAPRDAAVPAEHLRTVNAKLVEKVLALDESEARLEAFGHISPVGIAFGGAQLSASFVNPRLSQITGRAAGDLLGTGWLDCLPEACRSEIRTGPGSGRPVTCSGEIDGLDGRRRWLRVGFQQLVDSDHQRTGFVAMVDDVSEMIEAERRSHEEERAHEIAERDRISERFDSLARLSGAVAHDFNNMLNVILSFNEFVEDAVRSSVAGADGERILRDVDQIAVAGKRAAHLAHQLLTFGGRELVQPSVVSLNAIVTEVGGMMEATAGAQITIRSELDPALRNTRADASQLVQVLLNLAMNARDAMPHGGELVLRTANASRPDSLPAGDYVHVAVVDNGHGMPPEVADRAIEPFFTTKARGHGSGLGLATAYGIVKQAGGALTIDSAPGRGTTIHIHLPATTEPVRTSQPVAAARPTAGRTILLAEDEDGVRQVATRILIAAGYRVLAAPNGAEALELARGFDGPIHGVLTDVVMPVMTGPELAEALAEIRPGVPVVYMSGYAAPLMTEQGILPAGVTVVGKPFHRDELLATIATAIAGELVGA